MKTVQHDMTAGSPMKIILSFTLPIFIGNVFQQFYNMADAVIVGKFVGTKALAAVGSTGTIMFLIYGFVVGMTAGFTVLTAQKFGAGDMPAMRRTVAGASILSLIVGLILTAAFMLLMKPWLHLMNTPSDIFADAYAYIMIISGGILAQMLYNLLASILRALGNSKVPLYFLILSALLNIVLDLVFIIAFHMGALFCLHCKKGSGIKNVKRRLASIGVPPKNADQNRHSNGTAVFHHRHRDHDGTDFPEYPGFYPCSRVYGRRQDRTDRDTGIPGLGNNHRHICGPEHGRRQYPPHPAGI